MSGKKKNQHTVPQCYLKPWCIDNTEQMNVYDKKQQKQRINSIRDVTTERYFYDIKLSKYITDEEVDPESLDDVQYIEDFFANNVEGHFKTLLDNLIERALSMNRWEIKNCFFISEENKAKFSVMLSLQHNRGKAVRNSIADSSDCLCQALKDMGVPAEDIQKYTVTEDDLHLIHGEIILSEEETIKLSHIFDNHIWVLLINKSDQLFYTSDTPIGTKAHIENRFMPMNGLVSAGVEVFFPLSPNLILLLFERTHHKSMSKYDRKALEITDNRIVREYNLRCVVNSEREVYAKDGDFKLIDDMLLEEPDILSQPRSTMSWGGKTYTPNLNTQNK